MAAAILALTQGDPAGIGPEILARAALERDFAARLLLVAERAALDALHPSLPDLAWERLHYFATSPSRAQLLALDASMVAVFDPVGQPRRIELGTPGPTDAAGAMAALDAGIALVESGVADALVTAPIAKGVIAQHLLPGFVGHTDYLAQRAGLEHYGRDYLMAFLGPDLQVALLSTHIPLQRALDEATTPAIVAALRCLHRHAGGSIAVAGIDPHAGEGGLLGTRDASEVSPAVAAARAEGIDARGPESADSLFSRARHGEFDWVLALYHDQGLIAVKTACFGLATNWTLGLPYLRTSVDHGTAFAIAGRGLADAGPLAATIETTLKVLRGELPRRATKRPGR